MAFSFFDQNNHNKENLHIENEESMYMSNLHNNIDHIDHIQNLHTHLLNNKYDNLLASVYISH